MVPAKLTEQGGAPPALLAAAEVTDADLLAEYLASLSAHTRRAYAGDIRDFAAWLGVGSPGDAVSRLLGGGRGGANRLALVYRTDLERRGLSPATVARRLAALRSVVEAAGRMGRVDWALSVDSPSVAPLRDTRGPGRDVWRAMVAALGRRSDVAGARDLAIVRLLWDLVLRRNEVCGLDLEHVEFGASGVPASIWILGKGRKDRIRLELPARTAAILAVWLQRRGTAPGPLFAPLRQVPIGPYTRLTGQAILELVRRAGRSVAAPRGVRPHGLRHGGVTEARRKGADLRDLQLFARHADPRTTQRYIDASEDVPARIARLVSED